MIFWQRVKNELERGVDEGIHMVKGSATFVKEKAHEVTEEGKQRLHLFELRTRVKREMAELGGHIYELKEKVKNPLSEEKVQNIMTRIRKMEDEIARIEGKTKEAVKKIPAKLKRK